MMCGVDEAGRGPLAGSVIAAAVILHPNQPIPGLADSKKLSPKKREALSLLIKRDAFAWAIGRAEVEEIDTINILQASLLAMHRAVDALGVVPSHVQVDGNRCPKWPYESTAVVNGDNLIAEISAASILAKVYRDAEMQVLHLSYPEYRFDLHKGYPTAAHISALQTYGVSAVHRKSFGPVRKIMARQAK